MKKIFLNCLMLNRLEIAQFRNSLLTVQQVNPTLHQDSVNDIDALRRGTQLIPSAPPIEEGNTGRRARFNLNCSCPICLGDSFLPIETNCGHVFCGILIL